MTQVMTGQVPQLDALQVAPDPHGGVQWRAADRHSAADGELLRRLQRDDLKPVVEPWGRGQQQRDEPQPQLHPDGGLYRVADGERGVWQRRADADELYHGLATLHF